MLELVLVPATFFEKILKSVVLVHTNSSYVPEEWGESRCTWSRPACWR